MAKLDDWDAIMRGAFPSGGSKKSETSSSNNVDDPFANLTAALLEQQKNIEAQIKQQQKDLAESEIKLPKLNDAPEVPDLMQMYKQARSSASDSAVNSTAQTTNTQSIKSELATSLEADGLLAEGAAKVAPEKQGNFIDLDDDIEVDVLGQDAFVDGLIRAFRRPFLMGTKAENAKNTILITGKKGTGRHFTLKTLLARMAERGLIKNGQTTTLNLALYPDNAQEKIFLQDLYAALHSKGEVLLFENYENCHPAFLKTLSALVCNGEAQLSDRYLLNKEGIMIDAGTALSPKAIRSITPCSKYFVFFSTKGKANLADKFGASFVSAVGDSVSTESFKPEALKTLAARELNNLAQRTLSRLTLTLDTDEAVRDFLANSANGVGGMFNMHELIEQIFRALSEYCLGHEALIKGKATLSMQEGAIYFSINDGEKSALFDLLPAEYVGSLEKAEKALNDLVGLSEVKEFVRALADNVAVQKRREDAGLKSSALSMHMIYSGNPGTGKTTIARIVAQYLKAIGALSGGQLIEVSRADLVGRYSGHTAPLTNNVIQSALGGVLFIDEAYSLYRGEQDSFGLEAIDTLVKGMEDNRQNLVVVLAGYTKEMEYFLTANSGLASRFSRNIEFPDYTADELFAITEILVKSKGYKMSETCKEPLVSYYDKMQNQDASTAGNGRLARNTMEKAILNQSKRLIAIPDDDMSLLILEDFELEE